MFFLQLARKATQARPTPDPEEIISRLAPFAPPDSTGHLKKGRCFLVRCARHNTAASQLEPTPFYDQASGVAVAAWARIDNRADLERGLGLASGQARQMPDAELILKAWLKWGEDCPARLIGDFAFALYDQRREQVFCARDHMGVRPFFYHLTAERFVCATSAAPILSLEDGPRQIEGRWMADFIARLSMDFAATPYPALLKLPPAHRLSVTPETHRLSSYFELGKQPPLVLQDSREYVEAYRQTLEEAVRCRLDSEYPIASELSGGLDSSSVTALAAKFLDRPLENLHTFGMAIDELEPQYILSVSQMWRLPHNHIFAIQPNEKMDTAPRMLRIMGYPEEHSMGSSHERFYKMAQLFGARTMLSGFGGDEFGTTIHGNLVIRELVLARRYRELYNRLPGKAPLRLARLGRHILNSIRTRGYTTQKYKPGFRQAFGARWEHQSVRQELVRKYDLDQRYMDTARFDAGYTDLKKFTLEKRWMPFVPTRMECCNLAAGGHGIEYRWPLLDVRLVELFLAIPSTENFYRGMGRYLHRRAVADVVPPLVTWKRSKDMGGLVTRSIMNSDLSKKLDVSSLHPVLKELVDTSRLAGQLDYLAKTEFTGRPNNKAMQIRMTAQALLVLDPWLKGMPEGHTVNW